MRSNIFVALASFTKEELVSKLDYNLRDRVGQLADERAEKIKNLILEFNKLSDTKNNLLQVCPDFLRAKVARKKTADVYKDFDALDPALAYASLETICKNNYLINSRGSHFSGKSVLMVDQQPLFLTTGNLSVAANELNGALRVKDFVLRKSFVGLNESIFLNSQLMNLGLVQEKIQNLYNALVNDLLQHSATEASAHYYRFIREKKSSSFEKIFDQQLVLATQKVNDDREVNKEKIISYSSQLFDSLNDHYVSYKQCLSDQRYKQYKKNKAETCKVLYRYSKFCTKSELTSHPNISKDAIKKISKYCVRMKII